MPSRLLFPSALVLMAALVLSACTGAAEETGTATATPSDPTQVAAAATALTPPPRSVAIEVHEATEAEQLGRSLLAAGFVVDASAPTRVTELRPAGESTEVRLASYAYVVSPRAPLLDLTVAWQAVLRHSGFGAYAADVAAEWGDRTGAGAGASGLCSPRQRTSVRTVGQRRLSNPRGSCAEDRVRGRPRPSAAVSVTSPQRLRRRSLILSSVFVLRWPHDVVAQRSSSWSTT